MFIDMAWLSTEAKTIHQIFYDLFYPLVGVFLVLGVVVDYFKFPLGGVPSFGVLVGRALVAIVMLTCFSDVMNTVGDIANDLSNQIGGLSKSGEVLARMGEQLKTMTASWVSFKETMTTVMCFISFVLLHVSVYATEAFFIFTWTILYIISPILIALYVLPATAGATKALYRSLFEACMWKVMWGIIGALVWSMALSKINQVDTHVNVVTVICLNLILAGSLLLAPVIVHTLTGAGLSGYTSTVGSVAVGSFTFSPSRAAKMIERPTMKTVNKSFNVTKKMFSSPKKEVDSKPK